MSTKLNNRVVTTELYDSDDDKSDDNFDIDIGTATSNCDIEDEDTEELLSILSDLLEEVGDVYMAGKKKLRVEFFDANEIKFVTKKTKCDFDIADDLYPIMEDGGEHYFVPYMDKVKEVNPDFEGLTIETNVKGFKFKV